MGNIHTASTEVSANNLLSMFISQPPIQHPNVDKPRSLYVRAFHLETIHLGEINTPRYMKLLGYCKDQYLTLGF